MNKLEQLVRDCEGFSDDFVAQAAAELARLQQIEAERDALVNMMKSDSAVKLVIPTNPHVTRKLYWATDTEQWEVYSHDPSNRNTIKWHYKGDSLVDAIAALTAPTQPGDVETETL